MTHRWSSGGGEEFQRRFLPILLYRSFVSKQAFHAPNQILRPFVGLGRMHERQPGARPLR